MQIAIDRVLLWFDCGRHAAVGADDNNLRKHESAGALNSKTIKLAK